LQSLSPTENIVVNVTRHGCDDLVPDPLMRIQVLSDLHLEACEGFGATTDEKIPALAPSCDVLVLAGDIHRGYAGMPSFCDLDIPVVYVAGNHEFYNHHINRMSVDLVRCASYLGIDYLDASEVIIDGVRFLGTTLWTDFALYPGRERESLDAARNSIYDFSTIRTPSGFLTPEQTVIMHRIAREWLGEQLSKPFDGPTVVVTHHAPSARSNDRKFDCSPLTPAFCSDLDELAGKATVWIHGHCHNSSDYNWHGTRVVANPRGYIFSSARPLQWENPDFNPSLIVEV